MALAAGVFDHDGAQRLGRDVGDMEATGFAIPLHQGEYGLLLWGWAKRLVLGFAADKRFIGFDNLVSAAERRRIDFLGALAETVEQEPRGFVIRAQHPV